VVLARGEQFVRQRDVELERIGERAIAGKPSLLRQDALSKNLFWP
jgi:hypothetical protein|tara:strand:- start:23590 stop:23724 length:135 start_codon:yes stop_codon:yes gene_type:complete